MIQKIELHKGQILTRDNISRILGSARGTYQYARFTMYNKIYLNINYNKDNTIEISTNSRDIALWNQIQILRRNRSSLSMIVDFVFRWIPILNK